MAGFFKIKFIGGEPTLRKDLPLIIRESLDTNPSIDSSIITNGLFDPSYITDCLAAGLNRVNVTVHAWDDPDKMRCVGLTKNNIQRLKKNILYLSKLKRLTKLNYVVLKSQGFGELLNLIEWVNANQLILDILNVLHDGTETDKQSEYYDFSEIYQMIDAHYNILKVVPHENRWSLPSTRLILDDGGVINLKTNPLNHFVPFNSCKDCQMHECCVEGIKAIRLTEKGAIKPCLFRDDNVLNLRDYLNQSEQHITDKIVQFINDL